MLKRIFIILLPFYAFMSIFLVINHKDFSFRQFLTDTTRLEFIQLDLEKVDFDIFKPKNNLNSDIEFVGLKPNESFDDFVYRATEKGNISTGLDWLDDILNAISNGFSGVIEFIRQIAIIIYDIGYLLYFAVGNSFILITWIWQYAFFM